MSLLKDMLSSISFVGNSLFIYILVATTGLYLLLRKDWIKVLSIILCSVSSFYSTFLKGVFLETRPMGFVSESFVPWERLLVWETYSFPSTHVVVYTVFFGYLFYSSYTLKHFDKVIRHLIRSLSAIMVVLVGMSRVSVGAHYIKDVVAGYLFGFLYLAFVIGLEKLLVQKSKEKLLKHKKL